MARLSAMTGDYSQAGTIIDRQQIIAVGGETNFNLTFIDGAEEVYLNGARQLKGGARDYTTSATQIILNTALAASDELLLVGRASSNEIPFNKAVGETVVLADGQTEVAFVSIETEGIEIYVNGPLVDRGRLTSPQDYELRANSNTTIDLKHTFPEGTVIEGVQGGRLAWVDADNLVVNDGTRSKSLSARFRDTQESKEFFIESNGVQLQTLVVGLELKKWRVDPSTGVPVEDLAGNYPVLRVERGYWNPQILGSSLNYQVSSWNIVGDTMTIKAVDLVSGTLFDLTYGRRVAVSTALEGAVVDYGLITAAVYDTEDDGGL